MFEERSRTPVRKSLLPTHTLILMVVALLSFIWFFWQMNKQPAPPPSAPPPAPGQVIEVVPLPADAGAP